MKTLLLLLVLCVTVSAGSIWADYYADAVYDTRSNQSVHDSYYGLMRAGVSLEYGDIFLSYYQYGMYGPSNQLSYVGLGAKKTWVWDRVFFEPFIVFHRDFGADDNGIWFGVYVSGTIWKWGSQNEDT